MKNRSKKQLISNINELRDRISRARSFRRDELREVSIALGDCFDIQNRILVMLEEVIEQAEGIR